MEKNKSLIPKTRVERFQKYIPAHYLKRILDECDNIRDRAYIAFQSYTGLRISDVVGIQIKDIEWNQNRMKVWDEKKDSWRIIVMDPALKPYLRMWLKERQNRGIKGKELFPFCTKTGTNRIRFWARKVDFPFAELVGTHWLRHTFVRLSRAAGRDIKTVQSNTGDSVQTLLKWYDAPDIEEVSRDIIDKPLL